MINDLLKAFLKSETMQKNQLTYFTCTLSVSSSQSYWWLSFLVFPRRRTICHIFMNFCLTFPTQAILKSSRWSKLSSCESQEHLIFVIQSFPVCSEYGIISCKVLDVSVLLFNSKSHFAKDLCMNITVKFLGILNSTIF